MQGNEKTRTEIGTHNEEYLGEVCYRSPNKNLFYKRKRRNLEAIATVKLTGSTFQRAKTERGTMGATKINYLQSQLTAVR